MACCFAFLLSEKQIKDVANTVDNDVAVGGPVITPTNNNISKHAKVDSRFTYSLGILAETRDPIHDIFESQTECNKNNIDKYGIRQNHTHETVEDISLFIQKVTEVAQEVTEKAEEVAQEVIEKAEEVAQEVIEKAEEVTQEVTEKTEEVAQEVTEKTEEVAQEVTDKNTKATYISSEKNPQSLLDSKISSKIKNINSEICIELELPKICINITEEERLKIRQSIRDMIRNSVGTNNN